MSALTRIAVDTDSLPRNLVTGGDAILAEPISIAPQMAGLGRRTKGQLMCESPARDGGRSVEVAFALLCESKGGS